MANQTFKPIKEDDVVQIDPEHSSMFGGCFMTVTEVKSWGCQGYVMVPAERAGPAYLRVNYDHLTLIGKAVFKAGHL